MSVDNAIMKVRRKPAATANPELNIYLKIGLSMIHGKYRATALRIGLRVGVVCGPGEIPENRAGAVMRKEETRWGTRWEVQMDDGSREWICAMQTNELGIGWYSIGESA